ncbi:hypothetical protein [Methylobacterium gregans]|uniref:Uncharacterized protein n=1 Tax=Methylobacterium gregans TaxID=374424 RepID=A0AA37MB41_9HYPH|nr:hypothetical protein [Methylobacterium gregans]MDQ0521264.1 hypothetical protein [Methylobacterium gregans]GJD78483.1 hypothetical protein NBEOAGPD_1698 [Methylobacterium gregans]GLS54428.1 hypothetical protein GCM10007886_26110 [Methylobacterium gregans]
MNALPPPSRRVLADLGGTYPALRPTTGIAASSVQRALAELSSLLNAQATTFMVRDKVEAAFLRHRRFVRSDRLAAVKARDDALAARIDDTAVRLLLAPATDLIDLAIKVGVLIALSEAGPSDSTAFPGAHLRALFADLHQLKDLER